MVWLNPRLNFMTFIVWVTSLGLSCGGVDTRTPEEIAQDERITQRVLAKLDELPLMPYFQNHINVTTERGVVHVWGVIESRYMRDKVMELVRGVEGVRAVTQNIRIELERGGMMGGGSS